MINIEILYNEYGKNNVDLNHFDGELFPFYVTYIKSLDLYLDDLSDCKNGFVPYNPESDKDKEELKRLKESTLNADILKLNYWGKINRLKIEYIQANKLNYIGFYKNFKVEYKDGRLVS